MQIKRIFLFLNFIVFLGFFTSCATTDYYVKPGVEFSRFRRVGVLPFTPPPEVQKDQGVGISEGISDIVGTQLLKRGWDVIERARIRSIFEERNLALTHIPSGKNLEDMRNILGVDAFVTGSVTEWRERIRKRNDGAVGITIKIYDTRTGELVWSGSGTRPIGGLDDKRLTLHAELIIRNLCEKIPSR